jgi:AraC-like DNA-binding protein
MESLHIKNLVCNQCIKAAKDILKQLQISVLSIELGEVKIESPLDEEKRAQLRKILKEEGFELIEDKQAQLVNRIKNIIIEIVYYDRKVPKSQNLSNYIAHELQQDYTYLSALFSSLEGLTIEKYIIQQRIERVKELLDYGELTLSEIAFQLGYSSTQHLSNQFKRITGLTPTTFKAHSYPSRNPLDED